MASKAEKRSRFFTVLPHLGLTGQFQVISSELLVFPWGILIGSPHLAIVCALAWWRFPIPLRAVCAKGTESLVFQQR
ncbi:hypothetical protein PGT21_015458 [Puccinia graminis f. sp. tritici]|uniref:Uncharacterized protein n=1 Tax=Puccinia graminis f. sp. tritici TaxID=56615 RepID=A0A5B0NM48_PUCGR|nr:hypothetical protein PGT21_015458 [Puccinia graminis f. sp. tritici]KAA1089863.1 hypothetical protein PGTUg99_024716 [Puccinia graminis f. sp. tritici]